VDADGTPTKILATGYGWGMLFEHGGTPYVSSVASTYGLYRVNADGSVTSVYGSVAAAYVAYRFDNGAAVIATSARIIFITATGTVTSPTTFARARRVLGLSCDGSKVYLATDAGANGSLGILSVSQAGAAITMYSLGRNWDKMMEVNGKRYVTTTVTGTDGILELDEETGKCTARAIVSGDYDFHGEPFDKWIAGAYNGQLPMMDEHFRVVSYQSGYLDGDGVQYPAYTVNLHGFISVGKNQQRRVFSPSLTLLSGTTRITSASTGKNYYPTSGSVVFRVGSV
jgi:hypothetical protein